MMSFCGDVIMFSNDLKVALQGYTFKTVSELAASKHTPLIVCSTKSHLTGESKSSTQSDELLIVKKISRTTVMRKPVLKAFSLMTGEDKVLQVRKLTLNPSRDHTAS